MKIGIIGAGSWGQALAYTFSVKNDVCIYARNPLTVEAINNGKKIKASTELSSLFTSDLLVLALPTQQIRDFLTEYGALLPALPLVNTAKGIEQTTGKFISQIVKELAPQMDYALLSGPSFADDVLIGLPTAVTLAAFTIEKAEEIAQNLMTPSLRLYHTKDIIGAEIGGACKNVLAIASGIVAGKALGKSAESALISRGFAEITRFALSFGADPQTLTGLSGLGDIILSCNSPQSRNYAYGFALGRGETLPTKLAEGVFTASILAKKAKEQGVDMPICGAVHHVLQGKLRVNEAILLLLARPQRGEK